MAAVAITDLRQHLGYLKPSDIGRIEEARRDLSAVVRTSRLLLSSQSARHPEILKPFGKI